MLFRSQEETFKALAHEKEGWQRKHKGHISAIDCDRNHFIAQMTILKGYIGSLMGELRGYEIPVLLMPTMQGFDPPARGRMLDYILVLPGPAPSWGSFLA